jgi:hypothetical protein
VAPSALARDGRERAITLLDSFGAENSADAHRVDIRTKRHSSRVAVRRSSTLVGELPERLARPEA